MKGSAKPDPCGGSDLFGLVGCPVTQDATREPPAASVATLDQHKTLRGTKSSLTRDALSIGGHQRTVYNQLDCHFLVYYCRFSLDHPKPRRYNCTQLMREGAGHTPHQQPPT